MLMRRSLPLLMLAILIGGCADDSTMRQRQDSALRDPFNYSPYGKSNPDDISGGGTMEFKKDAFNRDVKSVFNP